HPLHLFLFGLVQRRKIRARNLRVRNGHELGDVVYSSIPLHFHHADRCFSAFGRKRNRHSPAQVLEVLPVIDLGLINDESRAIAIFFPWPARVAGLSGSGCGGSNSERQAKNGWGKEEKREKEKNYKLYVE